MAGAEIDVDSCGEPGAAADEREVLSAGVTCGGDSLWRLLASRGRGGGPCRFTVASICQCGISRSVSFISSSETLSNAPQPELGLGSIPGPVLPASPAVSESLGA